MELTEPCLILLSCNDFFFNIQDINYGIQEKVKIEIELGIIINNLEKSLIFRGSQFIADFGIHRTLIIENLELQPVIVQLADSIVHGVSLIDTNSPVD